MDNETAKEFYVTHDIPQPTTLVNQAAQLERDYWLKLYAGMAMQALSTDRHLRDLSWGQIAERSRLAAKKLVDEMFKDES